MKWYIKDGVFSRNESEGAAVFEVEDSTTNVVIPEGVTKISREAFRGCGSLTSITIPQGVTEIGELAFFTCSRLVSITLPEGVTKIGAEAFSGCSSLTSITIPEGVTTIGGYAFGGCKNLTSISLPENFEKIGFFAFDNRYIKHFHIVHWNNEEMKDCGIGENTWIHTDDFAALPAKWRGRAKFVYVMDGKDLTTEIGKDAAKFARANAGKYIDMIMQEPELMHAMLREKLVSAKDIDAFHAAAREKGDTELVAQLLDYQTNVLTTATVVKTRAKKAEKQEQDQELVIDRAAARANKKDLAGLVFAVTGKLETFYNRDELKTYLEKYGAKLASSVTAKTDYLVTNDTSSDSEKNKKAINLGVDVIDEKRLNEMLYRRFNGVKEVHIPDWITAIPPRAFMMCSDLTSVTIPESVTEIGYSAFSDCTSLTNVTIPESVTGIKSGAFSGCTSLTDITIKPGNSAYRCVDGCIFDQSGKVLVAYPACPSVYTVPDGVTEIGDSAFSGCKYLTTIILPDSVTKIGGFAFSGCKSLTAITLPDSVTKIESGVFSDCTSLTSITIPKNVTEIDSSAFSRCECLTDITLPDGMLKIGDYVFSNCTNLSSITIPGSVTEISLSLSPFEGCKKLVLHAPAGSYAEQYAKKNKIPFEPV